MMSDKGVALEKVVSISSNYEPSLGGVHAPCSLQKIVPCSLLPQAIFGLFREEFWLAPYKWSKMTQCSLLPLLFQYMLPAPSLKKVACSLLPVYP